MRSRAEDPSQDEPGWRHAIAWLAPLIGLLLFVAALWVLHRELKHVNYRQLMDTARALPPRQLLLALLFTAGNYLALTGYDHLAFLYTKLKLGRGRITMASFVAYAVANNVGFAILSGASVRYRFYSRWGVSASDLSRIVVFYSTTYWIGLITLSGWSLAAHPWPSLAEIPGASIAGPAGWLLLGTTAAYVVLASVRREPIRLRGFTLPVPGLGLVILQVVVSSLDWALAGAALWALIPSSDGHFVELLGAFVAAQVIALASHVPGGVGVFESVMVVLLKPDIPPSELLPALVLYRVIYYVLPLALALLILVVDEVYQRGRRLGTPFGAVTEELAPRLFGVFTFLGGALLLLTGSTPSPPERLALMQDWVPLAVLEAAHLTAGVIGVGLLVVSLGVGRRLSSAYALAVSLLGTGVVCALLRGADYEQAAALGMLLLGLLRTRDEFDRRTEFFQSRFPLGWSLSVLATVFTSVWLGAFAFKHVPAWGGLLWRFDYGLEPSRFLRQAVAASASLLAFAVLRVLWPRPSPFRTPADADLARAGRAMAAQTSTLPYLAYLRDKTLLFAPGSDAFVMYGVHGRTFVALGDPVGAPAEAAALIRAFLERCSDFAAQPVFHDVGASTLAQYADYGLTYVRVGDEARVPLGGEGTETDAAREARASAAAGGLRFRVAPPDEVRDLIPALRAVDEEWRSRAQAPDARFALGSFVEDYLARFPVAVLVRDDAPGEAEAFAILWPGAQGVELAIDHLRARGEDAAATERILVAEVAAWGRARGYAWLDLGLAPFDGVEGSPVAVLWERLAARHVAGRGGLAALRAEKELFRPRWEPRYLAYPGGLSLPLVLADVADLIAGAPRRPWRT